MTQVFDVQHIEMHMAAIQRGRDARACEWRRMRAIDMAWARQSFASERRAALLIDERLKRCRRPMVVELLRRAARMKNG